MPRIPRRNTTVANSTPPATTDSKLKGYITKEAHVVFDRVSGIVKVAKKVPRLSPDQIAFKLEVSVSEEVFNKKIQKISVKVDKKNKVDPDIISTFEQIEI